MHAPVLKVDSLSEEEAREEQAATQAFEQAASQACAASLVVCAAAAGIVCMVFGCILVGRWKSLEGWQRGGSAILLVIGIVACVVILLVILELINTLCQACDNANRQTVRRK